MAIVCSLSVNILKVNEINSLIKRHRIVNGKKRKIQLNVVYKGLPVDLRTYNAKLKRIEKDIICKW